MKKLWRVFIKLWNISGLFIRLSLAHKFLEPMFDDQLTLWFLLKYQYLKDRTNIEEEIT